MASSRHSKLLHYGIIMSLFVPICVPWLGGLYKWSSHVDFKQRGQIGKSTLERKLIGHLELLEGYERARSWIRLNIFNISPHRSLYKGKYGWFFRNKGMVKTAQGDTKIPAMIEDHIGKNPLTSAELKHWGIVLSQRYNYLRKRGIPYVFAIAPRKSEIYPEGFDPKLRRQFKKTRARQLIDYLVSETEVPVVDLHKYFKSLRQKHPSLPPLYFKTDGHWNSYGAYWAYRGILHASSTLVGIKLRPLSRRSFRLQWRSGWHHRGFSRFAGVTVTEPFPVLFPLAVNRMRTIPVHMSSKRFWQPLTLSDQKANPRRSVLLQRGVGETGYPSNVLVDKTGIRRRYTHIKNLGTPALDSVLVMGDSFGKKLLYFFAAHARNVFRYREIYNFDPHLLGVSKDIRGRIDLVIQELGQAAVGTRLPKNPQWMRAAL